jgi:biopolymer transport protein ExbD
VKRSCHQRSWPNGWRQWAGAAGELPEVQLRADQAVPYGRVAELIGQLQTAGLNRIAFVTEPGVAASATL